MADKKHDTPTRRWIADLVREHGPRGAVAAGKSAGRPFSLGMANRCAAEFAGTGVDPGAVPAPGAPAPPAPEPDAELLAATDPEQVLLISMKRAARFTGGQDAGLVLRALERIERAADRLEKLRKDRARQESIRRRAAILILPVEEP